ncbi:MAG: hypothetical protein FJZ67_09425, partial [Bacteroidetes bacterium]|nr:hypothetical protein [Bacteroidota bacterium]
MLKFFISQSFVLFFSVCYCQQFIFDYTGGDQNFTVPVGVTCMDIKVWGAGGGSADNSNGGYGGGAAFVGGRINV